MRELFMALSELEASLIDTHGISLNEAMVLCSVGNETVAANTIVKRTGMKPSHTSKVIASAERKGFLNRELGSEDKRQMFFSLTDKAKKCLDGIKEKGVAVPDLLLPLFRDYIVADCQSF